MAPPTANPSPRAHPLLGALPLVQLGRLLVLADAQLGRLEGLHALPHGPAEDLLVLLLVLLRSQLVAAVEVFVLRQRRQWGAAGGDPQGDPGSPRAGG